MNDQRVAKDELDDGEEMVVGKQAISGIGPTSDLSSDHYPPLAQMRDRRSIAFISQ